MANLRLTPCACVISVPTNTQVAVVLKMNKNRGIFEYSNIWYTDSPLHLYKAEFFKTLGHSVRLAILDALREGHFRSVNCRLIYKPSNPFSLHALATATRDEVCKQPQEKPRYTTMSMTGKSISSLDLRKKYIRAPVATVAGNAQRTNALRYRLMVHAGTRGIDEDDRNTPRMC